MMWQISTISVSKIPCVEVGNHQGGEVILVFFRFGTQVGHIHIALCVAGAGHGGEAAWMADAGLVPCADAGISTLLRCPCPMLSR